MSAQSSTVSRRGILGAIAATAALPAITTAALATTDPIFALIEQHRIARQRYDAARDAAGALQQSLPYDVGRGPRVQISWKTRDGGRVPIYAYSHDQISETAARLMENYPGLVLKEWKRAKHATFQADVVRQRVLQKGAGLYVAIDAEKEADLAEAAAIRALYEALATTPAGLLAFTSYMLKYESKYYAGFEQDPDYSLVAAVQRSLEGMAQS
jgi:hypothetical protein